MLDPTPEDLELDATFEQLLAVGGPGRPGLPAGVTSLMIPGATEEQMRWLDGSNGLGLAENAVAARRQRSTENVVGLSQPRPSDAGAPLPWRPDERLRGGPLASNIANSRLVPLEARTTSCSATSRHGT